MSCLLCLQPSLPVLYTLSSQATHEAVHLLCRMLVFDPVSLLLLVSETQSVVINYEDAVCDSRVQSVPQHGVDLTLLPCFVLPHVSCIKAVS